MSGQLHPAVQRLALAALCGDLTDRDRRQALVWLAYGDDGLSAEAVDTVETAAELRRVRRLLRALVRHADRPESPEFAAAWEQAQTSVDVEVGT